MSTLSQPTVPVPRMNGFFRVLAGKHRWAIISLFIFALGYGCLVEIRGALIQNRHTDAGVYFAAAWSIRIGSDPYFARDRNGWHYLLPPLLAVLSAPVCHPHYLMLMLPLVSAVIATFLGPRGQKEVSRMWIIMLATLPLSHIMTAMPGGQLFRDLGLVAWVAVGFWAVATRLLWVRTRSTAQPSGDELDLSPSMNLINLGLGY